MDETAIIHEKWDVLDKKIFDCVTQPEPVSIIFVCGFVFDCLVLC